MRAFRRLAGLALVAWMAAAGTAAAETRTIALAADARLEASGLLQYLLPRFSLKHRVRVELAATDAAALPEAARRADAVLGPLETARALFDAGAAARPRPAFHVEGRADETYAAALVEGAANADHAGTFLDWLTSEVGQRTVAAFEAPDAPAYLPGALAVGPAEAPVVEGDADEGERLAQIHCGRCHVVSERNPFGGIGSTPSFPALRALSDWQNRFVGFYALNPHPSFTVVEDVTPPFDPKRPPHIAPVELTLDETEAIAAFVASLEPKDLGAPVSLR